MNRGFPRARGFRRIHLSAFRYGLTKNGFAARKVSGSFGKRAPDRLGIWNVGFYMEEGKLENQEKNPRNKTRTKNKLKTHTALRRNRTPDYKLEASTLTCSCSPGNNSKFCFKSQLSLTIKDFEPCTFSSDNVLKQKHRPIKH